MMTTRQKRLGRFMLSAAIGLVITLAGTAQRPFLSTSVDKKDILIGEHIKLTVKAIFPSAAYRVNWFSIPDSLNHFEVVERGKIDTATNSSNSSFEQTIIFTSFDSGRWNTPELAVNFEQVSDGQTIPLLTESIPVNVGYAPADSTNELRDIKPIIEVKITDYTWLYITGGVIVIALIIFLLWRYFKKRPKKAAPRIVSKLSPYEEAVQALKELQQTDLHDASALKPYYTRLADVLKRYLARIGDKDLSDRTTGDLLILLSSDQLQAETLSSLAAALRTGDAVKFAKYQPMASESEESLEAVARAIEATEQKRISSKT